jgi:hypothetical protein
MYLEAQVETDYSKRKVGCEGLGGVGRSSTTGGGVKIL